MEVTDFLEREPDAAIKPAKPCKALAAGLFGYSIFNGRASAFKPTAGYLRDLEQMPHFGPPSIDSFVAQYVRSNLGTTESTS